jgi:cytochrome b pre-mRNA-processing protein 3
MLRYLFPRLTPSADDTRLFDWVTAEARSPGWYRECGVADTLDGRFAMLATIMALVVVRLEREGEPGNSLSVALTERFIEVMEAEHRELGLGDPALGRTVRKLVGSLARRVELWRSVIAGEIAWSDAARESLYKAHAEPAALEQATSALQSLWQRLEGAPLEELQGGLRE